MPTSPRAPRPTIGFVDEYCQLFAELFPQVRRYEAFKLLHLGMISEIKRKSLPAIAEGCWFSQSSKLASFPYRVALDCATAPSTSVGADP